MWGGWGGWGGDGVFVCVRWGSGCCCTHHACMHPPPSLLSYLSPLTPCHALIIYTPLPVSPFSPFSPHLHPTPLPFSPLPLLHHNLLLPSQFLYSCCLTSRTTWTSPAAWSLACDPDSTAPPFSGLGLPPPPRPPPSCPPRPGLVCVSWTARPPPSQAYEQAWRLSTQSGVHCMTATAHTHRWDSNSTYTHIHT